MFDLYARLIEGIPAGIPVEQICSGSSLTAVCADDGIGLCETVVDHRRSMTLDSTCRYDLQTLATYAQSWNYVEASIGMAAINCYVCKEWPCCAINSMAIRFLMVQSILILFRRAFRHR